MTQDEPYFLMYKELKRLNLISEYSNFVQARIESYIWYTYLIGWDLH